MSDLRFRGDDFMRACACRSPGECSGYCRAPFADKMARDALVDAFAGELKAKLNKKAAEGRDGWDEPDWVDAARRQLRVHVDKGDPLDVAALAAFLWNLREATA